MKMTSHVSLLRDLWWMKSGSNTCWKLYWMIRCKLKSFYRNLAKFFKWYILNCLKHYNFISLELNYLWEYTFLSMLKNWHNIHSKYQKCNKIHSLNGLEVFTYQQLVLRLIWKVLGAIYEHSHYSVEFNLNSLYHDSDSTFHTTYLFSTYLFFRKTSSQHFTDKGICVVLESTYIKLGKNRIFLHFLDFCNNVCSLLIPVSDTQLIHGS